MKRVLVLLPAAAVVFVLASPAAAKPWHEEPIAATATIEGSELRGPVDAPVSTDPSPTPVVLSPWLLAFVLLGLLVAAGTVLGRRRHAPALGA